VIFFIYFHQNYLTKINFMELSPFWEAASRAATQELPNILWNPMVKYRFYRALHWSLSWAKSIQSIPPQSISLRYILILSTHLLLGLPSGLFPSGFPIGILYAFLFFPLRVTFPVYFIVLDLIILIILGEKYKLWSPSSCISHKFPVTHLIRTTYYNYWFSKSFWSFMAIFCLIYPNYSLTWMTSHRLIQIREGLL
jgi:hypothetical protein